MNKILEVQEEIPAWIDQLNGFKHYDSATKELTLQWACRIDAQIVDFKDYITSLILIDYQDRHVQSWVKYLTLLENITIKWWNIVLFPPEFRGLPNVETISITHSPLEQIWPDSIPDTTLKLILDNNPNLKLPFLKKRDKPLEFISAINSNVSIEQVKERISQRITVILK